MFCLFSTTSVNITQEVVKYHIMQNVFYESIAFFGKFIQVGIYASKNHGRKKHS